MVKGNKAVQNVMTPQLRKEYMDEARRRRDAEPPKFSNKVVEVEVPAPQTRKQVSSVFSRGNNPPTALVVGKRVTITQIGNQIVGTEQGFIGEIPLDATGPSEHLLGLQELEGGKAEPKFIKQKVNRRVEVEKPPLDWYFNQVTAERFKEFKYVDCENFETDVQTEPVWETQRVQVPNEKPSLDYFISEAKKEMFEEFTTVEEEYLSEEEYFEEKSRMVTRYKEVEKPKKPMQFYIDFVLREKLLVLKSAHIP